MRLAPNVIAIPLRLGQCFRVQLPNSEARLEIQLDDVRENAAGLVVSVESPMVFDETENDV